jgi:hypothetical protein
VNGDECRVCEADMAWLRGGGTACCSDRNPLKKSVSSLVDDMRELLTLLGEDEGAIFGAVLIRDKMSEWI